MTGWEVLARLIDGIFGVLREIFSKWYVYLLIALAVGIIAADVVTDWFKAVAGKIP